ncbi:hypothetical protein EHV15_35655 [Paenibacillus oralis]|uniref:Uncharacterized protein n=1 Tax=Paenibacillus oralis TaxID=2490856 RepID=A0A3P3TAC6_9BACL|nr:hypothetical protein [Paenibacillus oralis]RRJ54910.1 hypothetical protein EHV15_35655 [Paenibacillus oralis]
MITSKKLDDLFRRISSGEANKRLNKRMVRSFPNLAGELDTYKEKLASTPFVPREKILAIEVFIKQMTIDPLTEYTVFWDIDKAIHLAKRMSPGLFPMEYLQVALQTNQADLKSYVKGTPDLNIPIIVVLYAPVMEAIIIDGNHRAHQALKESKGAIMSNLFFNGTEMQLIADPHSQLMYKIHWNVSKILAYQAGMFDNIQYSNEFDLNTLFRI